MKTLKLTNILACAILMLSPLVTAAQPLARQWVQRYNGPSNGYDYAGPMTIDNSGNVYVAGQSDGVGTSNDIAVIKYNSSGIQQWVARYNGPANNNESPAGIAVDNSGNVYVAGTSWGTNDDYITIKYNSSGVQQWAARFNGSANSSDRINAMTIDNSGNIYVTGQAQFNNGLLNDYFTIKYNSNGDTLWTRRYDGGENPSSAPNDYAYSVAVDQSGNVYVTGGARTYPSVSIIATLKYNSSGVVQWVKWYNGPDTDEGFAIKVDASGNSYVTGRRSNLSNNDYITLKMNPNGDTSWVKLYNGPGNGDDRPYALVLDGSGNTYVTGYSTGSSTLRDFTTIKYNSSGIQQWIASYNGAANNIDEAYSIVVDNSSNVYIAGSSHEGSPTNYDFTAIKYNSSGAQQWIIKFDSLSGNGYCSSVAVDAQYNVYMFGAQPFNNVFHDMFTIKYAQLVGIKPVSSAVPDNFSLSQNYPNPFNPSTNIKFSIPKLSIVKIIIYDELGRDISTLVNEQLPAGTYKVDWNAEKYSSGVYFYSLKTDGNSETRKMILVK